MLYDYDRFFYRLAGYYTVQKLHEQYDEQFGPENVDSIILSDPTYQEGSESVGSYTPWIIKILLSGTSDFDQLGVLGEGLTLFNRYKRNLEQRDIYQYNSFEELLQAIQPYLPEAIPLADKSEDIIYNDGTWIIVVPYTFEAECEWGKDTKWCTTAFHGKESGKATFESALKDSYLYILINQETGAKYQFDEKTQQFKNKNDIEAFTEFLDSEPSYNLLTFIRNIAPRVFSTKMNDIKEETTIRPLKDQIENIMPSSTSLSQESIDNLSATLDKILGDNNTISTYLRSAPINSYYFGNKLRGSDYYLAEIIVNFCKNANPPINTNLIYDDFFIDAIEEALIVYNNIITSFIEHGYTSIRGKVFYNPQKDKSMSIYIPSEDIELRNYLDKSYVDDHIEKYEKHIRTNAEIKNRKEEHRNFADEYALLGLQNNKEELFPEITEEQWNSMTLDDVVSLVGNKLVQDIPEDKAFTGKRLQRKMKQNHKLAALLRGLNYSKTAIDYNWRLFNSFLGDLVRLGVISIVNTSPTGDSTYRKI